jgi:hypothetical protein
VDDDANEEEELLYANDGSIQIVEDWRHSTRECEHWTEYFRPEKYDNGKANAMASNVPQVKTLL